MNAVQDNVHEGLSRILADTPVRHGYLELTGGAAQSAGAYVRSELVYRPWENVAAYLYGQLASGEGWSTGGGVRLTF